jgi:hypothetical protein
MTTDLDEARILDDWPGEAHSPEAVAYLRAHGVRPATGSLNRPRVIAKQRPWWLALILRTLRKLRLYDD